LAPNVFSLSGNLNGRLTKCHGTTKEDVLEKYSRNRGINFRRRASSSISELDDEVGASDYHGWRVHLEPKVLHLIWLSPSVAFMEIIKTYGIPDTLRRTE
jgi:hypothetical protein